MARNKKVLPLLEKVEITGVAAEGKSIGRVDDMVVFVPFTAPGDVVDVKVLKKKRRFMEGVAVKYHSHSPDRAVPFCEHFGVCGGCKWQHIPYSMQLEHKRQQVIDQLVRIGKLEVPHVPSTLPSAETRFYRNKLEYTFSPSGWITQQQVEAGEQIDTRDALGFHIPGRFDKVLDIKKCWLQPDPSNEIRLAVKEVCIEGGYSFYEQRTHTGSVRNVMIRTASTGEIMVAVIFAHNDAEMIGNVMGGLQKKFADITSLMYVINQKLNDSFADLPMNVYAGRDHIWEEMEGLRFKIGGKSFYQTNSAQAHELYKVTREFAGLKGSEVVYDLYTGTGTIANFVARDCKSVIGIEYVEDAIADARVNSQVNAITNTLFFAGDMKNVLNDQFIATHGKPDVVILDPPRAGVHEDVIATILRASPEKIVYVSCNPASQARDLGLMQETYVIDKIQPVDMFPHTHHVENVVRLVKR